MREKWLDDNFRSSVSVGISEKWQNDDIYRSKCTASNANNGSYKHSDEHIANGSVAIKLKWQESGYRSKQIKLRSDRGFLDHISDGLRRKWLNHDYRIKMALARLSFQKVSSVQLILYRMLDDLGIKYFREYNDRDDDNECRIGYYTFDCRIPIVGRKDLLIEVQGDYWHSLSTVMLRDRQKRSYIENNFGSQFELKYIWEHELLCESKAIGMLREWLELEVQYVA
jgi:hypothetical protein